MSIQRNEFKALMVGKSSEPLLDLKRLSLIFDEIFLPPAGIPAIDNDLVSENKDGNILIKEPAIDVIIDLLMPTINSTKPTELKDAYAILQEHSILKEMPLQNLGDLYKSIPNFDYIIKKIAVSELHDETFRSYSDTPKDALVKPLSTQGSLTVESGKIFHIILLPDAYNDSTILTKYLALSYQQGYCPVFMNSRYEQELDYRFRRYAKDLEFLNQLHPDLLKPEDLNITLGQIAFAMTRELIPAYHIARRSFSDIINYRNAMKESRFKWISSVISELHTLVKDNPWSQATKNEINRFIVGKVAQSLAEFQSESKQIWEAMFGRLSVQTIATGRTALLGAGASGLIGAILPNISTLEIALAGGLVASVKEAPGIAQSLIDAFLAQRKAKTNAIAYIAKF